MRRVAVVALVGVASAGKEERLRPSTTVPPTTPTTTTVRTSFLSTRTTLRPATTTTTATWAASAEKPREKAKNSECHNSKPRKKEESDDSEEDEKVVDAAVLIGGYKKVRTLGSGVAGIVYEVVKSGKKFALKRAKRQSTSLKDEFEFMRLMNGTEGFPAVYALFECGKRDCLVMELMGPVLSSIQRHVEKFPLPTVASIAIQMIDRMEALHKRGLVHGDLYRNNVCPGHDQFRSRLYAIDFGQVSTASKPKRFDAKSIGFTVLGLLDVGDKYCHFDRYADNKGLMRGVPTQIVALLKHVESLEHDDPPNYTLMRKLMVELLESLGHKYKGEIVWTPAVLSILDEF